ncbi:MAG: 2-amino-4-hydroxy-6-hydroxymethyldihydropteridine diphosphokinase [Candidatus Bipolaricaulia bacterium]
MRSGRSTQEPGIGRVNVFLSLGSNLGDRRRAIGAALESLERRDVALVARSSLYETEPTDFEDQPWFLNQVVEAETSLTPDDLMQVCKGIESDLGRLPGRRFGPRALDIDVLLYGRETIEQAGLVVPHPRMNQRRFVLIPLGEIAPELTDPRDGRRYADILNGLDEGKKVVRSASTES